MAKQNIKPDSRNYRIHSAENQEMIKKSLLDNGAGRSILLDNEDEIIAGNETYNQAQQLGIPVKIIETDGKTLIAIKRTDLATDDEARKNLAIVDNLASDKSEFDFEMLKEDFGIEFLDDIGFDVFNIDAFKDEFNEENLPEKTKISDDFVMVPFSILDTRSGEWLQRKREWLSLGFNSQESREDVELIAKSGQSTQVYELRNKMRELLKREPSWDEIIENAKQQGIHVFEGASIFDPVLCELMYRWFTIPNGKILDPFAGGSVRGIVASKLGYEYHGIDLRKDQVEANEKQAKELNCQDVEWYIGDSEKVLEKYSFEKTDFIFSCPPYAYLEKYSDDPDDLSNMSYEDFLTKYRNIIKLSVENLKDDSFACFVVGDIRDKIEGTYKNFVSDTIAAFQDAGMKLYNEMILINSIGSMAIRLKKQFNSGRKCGKIHQNVLVFYKGNPKNIKEKFGELKLEIDLDKFLN